MKEKINPTCSGLKLFCETSKSVNFDILPKNCCNLTPNTEVWRVQPNEEQYLKECMEVVMVVMLHGNCNATFQFSSSVILEVFLGRQHSIWLKGRISHFPSFCVTSSHRACPTFHDLL
uniref:Uncharacterized protein n=1 Tax=Micrurus surinamensis TaxID=129470 RepID=A0A2D4PCB3_MICSU